MLFEQSERCLGLLEAHVEMDSSDRQVSRPEAAAGPSVRHALRRLQSFTNSCI